MGVLRPCGLAAPSPAASCRLYGGVEAVRAGCPQRVGGFTGVLRPCGLAAGGFRAGCPQRVGRFTGVLRRVGCPQRVGGFMAVLRPCGLAARSELEALWA